FLRLQCVWIREAINDSQSSALDLHRVFRPAHDFGHLFIWLGAQQPELMLAPSRRPPFGYAPPNAQFRTPGANRYLRSTQESSHLFVGTRAQDFVVLRSPKLRAARTYSEF